MPLSVPPWMLAWPRKALMPPPGRPMLPSSSCSIAAACINCTEWLWCVHPSAYMIVPARSAVYVDVIISAAAVNASGVQPQMVETISGVYRA
jgi:hypothetical protein